ncbi:hypothetical protein GCM10010417_13650 [Streptomyces carpaticus]
MGSRVAKVRIGIGGIPGTDVDRTGNARNPGSAILPFDAELDMEQNGTAMDGVLRWFESV